MCHEIVGRERNVQYLPFGYELVGTKSMLFDNGIWKSNDWDYTYSVKDNGWFHSSPKEQDLTFRIPLVVGTTEVKSTCMAGMHVASFNQCNRLEALHSNIMVRSIDSLLIDIDRAPVLFMKDDIVFFDGEDVSVKAFRLPTEYEVREIANIAFHASLGEETFSCRMEDCTEVLSDKMYNHFCYLYGFPYYEDGKFFLLLIDRLRRGKEEICVTKS